MKPFLKENLVLIAGVALPLVLALVFFIATRLPLRNIVPPQTSIVYADNYSPGPGNPWTLTVEDGKLEVSYIMPATPAPYCCTTTPELHLFNPVTGTDSKFELPLVKNQHLARTPVASLKNVKLDDASTSPDGFVFEPDDATDANILSDLFGGGDSDRGRKYILRKDNYHLTVKAAPAYGSHFLGWVVP